MKKKISNSFIRGYTRALDISGSTKVWPNLSDDRMKDYEALRGDWKNVGDTIRRETRGFEQTGCSSR